ncbi:hypothetical protein ACE41H_06715 [Paenibacillus enshidis]|uniref:Uncharacterized protein n=1 Tax=Paenibacillus enshidis TaxID=1458439 RepID=A0ABV5AQK6_9BACL
MEEKTWRFKVQGEHGEEVVVRPDEIRTVYDLLGKIRNNGRTVSRMEPPLEENIQLKTVEEPFWNTCTS